MDKKEVAKFFDSLAGDWDAVQVRDEKIIAFILDKAGIKEGVSVLDVACGTGVLIPDYMKRKAAEITGIDLSPEMINLARMKFPGVNLICGDAETYAFEEKFDCIMIYNAFPHFPDPKGIITALAGTCKKGGRLTVAHSISREHLKIHHSGAAARVSIDLSDENELAEIFESQGLKVDVKISDDEKYIVSGIRI